MTPNLFVCAKTLVQPHNWFRSTQKAPQNTWCSTVKHTAPYYPVTGLYQYKLAPGIRGEYLVAIEDPKIEHKYDKISVPRRVVEVRVLHRRLFKEDADARTKKGFVVRPERDSRSGSTKSPTSHNDASLQSGTPRSPKDQKIRTFVRLDDGITWVKCFDGEGAFIEGPYEKFVPVNIEEIEANNTERNSPSRFRPMLKGDDRAWRKKRSAGQLLDGASSDPYSATASLHTSSGETTLSPSRASSSGDLKV